MEARVSDLFVGRHREFAVLERALGAARAGSGATVLVTGEAGIGKSRLASELARRARDAGCAVLLGRSIELVGTELPYQPLVDALRPIGAPRLIHGQAPGSQLRLFEHTLDLLTEQAISAPVLLVLEDLHWADASTLDLVVYLAHHLAERPILLLSTVRSDEPESAERMHRLAEQVRRSGSAILLGLCALERDDVIALLEAEGPGLPAAVAATIVARAEGNPFFAQELLAAGEESVLSRGLRDLLLQRITGLDRSTQAVLRVAAAAGRDVGYPLLQATVAPSEHDVLESLREAVDHGVLVAVPASTSFRFRHALLAEAVYDTILPGERERVHARIAEELARSDAATPAELAPHWAAAGRTTEALVASVGAARQAEAMFGLAEAVAHVERALTLWPAVPGAADLLQLDLAELRSWAAELASRTGAAPRAVELAQSAIDAMETVDPRRVARLHDRLGRYLHESGQTDAALSAYSRAVELIPAEPPSTEYAEALAALATGLMLAWRFDESLAVSEQALALARSIGAPAAELRALLDAGRDLAYVGRADEGVDQILQALEQARAVGDVQALVQGYVSLTDVLLMLGRPRESAQQAAAGLADTRRYGLDTTVLVANHIEALLASGEWDEADRASESAVRAMTANFPYMLLGLRAELELGRGDFDAARTHLANALPTLREDRGQGIYDVGVAELALWERRWTEADEAVGNGLARATARPAAQLHVWFCAKGLRASAELAALARARRDTNALRSWLTRARHLIATARRAAKDAIAVTPNTDGWLALAEAEYQRTRAVARPESWSHAAATWARLERPPLSAYCRWREAEALVAAGASRPEASVPLREAHAVAVRIGADPLRHELELLAQRARLDLAPENESPDRGQALEETLGLTPREVEVLALVARGYTNREIAAALVISVKTASVHVSHILRKLDAPNRREAAAIAHRVAPRPIAPP
jgi:DNA-binding CsgD family transcriptional regulator